MLRILAFNSQDNEKSLKNFKQDLQFPQFQTENNLSDIKGGVQ